MSSLDPVHTFANGVRVYRRHLLPIQLERYQQKNVHEADEEEYFVELIRSLPVGGLYIDVGAAIGYYVILARFLRQDLIIHAFEPLPAHRQYLAENLQLNGLEGDSRILVHDEAVAGTSNGALLEDRFFGSRLTKEKRSSAYLTRLASIWASLRGKSVNHVPIATTTLDLFIGALGCDADLVQMDIQGFEAEALSGARECLRRKAIRTFLIGTHGVDQHNRCRILLTSNGYSITLENRTPKNQPDGILIGSVHFRTWRSISPPFSPSSNPSNSCSSKPTDEYASVSMIRLVMRPSSEITVSM